MKKIRAFTLIELMMVMVIIGILASLITTGAFRSIRSARESRAESDIVALEAALERYKLDTGVYPNNTSGTNSFKLWLQTGDGSTGWNGPYMSFKDSEVSGNAFLDPWGNAYIYYHNQTTGKGYNHIYPGYNTQNAFDIWSYGPDGANDATGPNYYIDPNDPNEDDITSWD
jgi:general secretion pathway protein G